MHVTFVTTAGTIFQQLDPTTGRMVIGVTLADIISPGWLEALGITSHASVDLAVRSGAELTYDTIFAARDAVLASLDRSTGVVLVTGTDTLDEFAFCLDLLLGSQLVAASVPLVVTGAMKPYDIEGYDGRANLQQAVQVSTSRPAGRFGVLVALNDTIHLARYVAKADSQLMGAFRSHPGPVGQVREGRVRFYYGPPPDDELLLRDLRFTGLDSTAVRRWSRVGIWTSGVSGFLPAGLLAEGVKKGTAAPHEGEGVEEAEGAVCGLVVAAPGTGSLSAALLEQLAPYTSRLPVVLVSRCPAGNNHDDCYYRGSRAKYEARGFLLTGFEHVNAVQARSLLVLRLAAGVYPQYTGGVGAGPDVTVGVTAGAPCAGAGAPAAGQRGGTIGC